MAMTMIRKTSLLAIFALLALFAMCLLLLQELPSTQLSSAHHVQKNILPADLEISTHAVKHANQQLNAWVLYDLLSTNACVETRKFCDGSREIYLCRDPVSGLMGALIIEGTTIITGYAARDSYWLDKIDTWEVCQ